jgi:hypothetical protein
MVYARKFFVKGRATLASWIKVYENELVINFMIILKLVPIKAKHF